MVFDGRRVILWNYVRYHRYSRVALEQRSDVGFPEFRLKRLVFPTAHMQMLEQRYKHLAFKRSATSRLAHIRKSAHISVPPLSIL